MTSTINNILKNLYSIGFPAHSEEEQLEKCYAKSRKAARDFAKETDHQEDLFYNPLKNAQETEFRFFKAEEEAQIEKTYGCARRYLAYAGGHLIEKEEIEEPALQEQFNELWMILTNSRTDEQIRNTDTQDNLSAIIETSDRDILKNEASRLYKTYRRNYYQLQDPYTLSNYADPEETKKKEKIWKEVTKKFPDLCCPAEELAKKQARVQLQKDINASLILSAGAITALAITSGFAAKYFAKKS